jgi:hypothetical protein
MGIFILWAVLCLLLAWWADSWNRSPLGYFPLALLTTPVIAGIVLLTRGKKEDD